MTRDMLLMKVSALANGSIAPQSLMQAIDGYVESALAAERERAIEECAKVADGYAEGHDTATVIADEIRALAAPAVADTAAPQRAEGEG